MGRVGDPASMRWMTTTAGQRAVTMEDSDGASTPIPARDFNLYAVRSARTRAATGGHLRQRRDWIEDLPNGNVITLSLGWMITKRALCGVCVQRRHPVVAVVRRGCDSGGIPLPGVFSYDAAISIYTSRTGRTTTRFCDVIRPSS
jgi:hypothetical protein